MKQYGFTDYKFWCTPYGVWDEQIRNLARKWGFECTVSSGQTGYETTKAKHGRYALWRMSFESEDKDGSLTLTQIKEEIDNASLENGWVLITTHMGESAWANSYDRFAELVNYAKSKGFEVRTLNDAWRIRKPIYEFYEMF